MPTELKIPELGESITEAQIVNWRKAEGDRVEVDEVVADLETDKATLELPSTMAGVIESILQQEGATVAVGEAIARIAEGPSKDDASQSASAAPEAAETQPQDNPHRNEAEAAPPVEPTPRLMPAAKTVMDELGVRPEQVEGTGPAGRIMPRDVHRAAAQQQSRDDVQERVVTMTELQQQEATNADQVWRTIPQGIAAEEIDLRELDALLAKVPAELLGHDDNDLHITAFIAASLMRLIDSFPEINAEIRGIEIVHKTTCHLAVAMRTEGGDVSPVIRNAEQMTPASLSRALSDAREHAGRDELTPEDLAGGTLTLEASHDQRVMFAAPGVRLQQSAAFSINAIGKPPNADASRRVVISMAYDRRIVQQPRAETLLSQLRAAVEQPIVAILSR